MNTLGFVCVCSILIAVGTNGNPSKTRPSQWISSSQSEQTPSYDDISVEKLENMSIEKGNEVVERIYHLSRLNRDMRPNFVPSPSNIAVYYIKPNGKKVTTTLDKLAATMKQQPNFGNEEVTIYITGLPSSTETVKKANYNLIEAYLQRYSAKSQLQTQPKNEKNSWGKPARTSSEEDSSEVQNQEPSRGDLVVIDLGEKLNNFKRYALLDVQQTGAMIASAIIEMIEKSDVPDETIHIVAQGIAAHVAGAAGTEYIRQTGRRLRRITALDPSKILASDPNTLIGLSRGDAEFVDAIHTSVHGLGTIRSVGDVDFYPNGPTTAVPGAKNVVEASMRATRYYAESVRPGQERNFPAVEANSLKAYKNNDGHGKRVYMGLYTDYDVKGDYMLEVNEKSPFGKRAPAQKQNNYHGTHSTQHNN